MNLNEMTNIGLVDVIEESARLKAELTRRTFERVVELHERLVRIEAAPEIPGKTPHCAGRRAVAHDRTAMQPTADGWTCPVCGETS